MWVGALIALTGLVALGAAFRAGVEIGWYASEDARKPASHAARRAAFVVVEPGAES